MKTSLNTLTHYPLSSRQQEIWFDQALQPEVPLYNVGGYLRINGAVDPIWFEKALNQIIQENDALRTILFKGEKDLPTQVFAENVCIPFSYHDFSGQENAPQQALEWMEQEFVKPFSIYGELLFQFALLKISEACYYWLGKYHHIIIDGWASSLIVQRVAAAYNAFLVEHSPIEQTHYSYQDFLPKDQAYFESEKFTQDKRYWLDKFQNVPEPLIPRRYIAQFHGKTIPSRRTVLHLERTFYNQLIAFAKKHEQSTFHVLLGALYCYFIRTTGQKDFVIGLPTLNRNTASFKQTIGLFTSVSPAWFGFGTDLNFIELIHAISIELRRDYRHLRFPTSQLNRQLGLYQENRQQLFDLVLSYMDQDYDTHFEGNTVEAIGLTTGFEQNTLILFVDDVNKQKAVRINFDYSLGAFDEFEIESIKARLKFLLGEILRQPEVPIRELQIMPETELQKILVEFNNTTTNYPSDKTIVDLFEEQAETNSDAIALVFEEQQLTYRTLNAQANQLAHHLQTLGVKQEVLVGICIERSLEMVVGILGILKAGGAYVPLDPTYPRERLAFMLEDTQISVLLSVKKLVNRLPSHQAQIVCLDTDWKIISGLSEENPLSAIKSENLVYVIYTSGSTGQPKGVEIQHNSLINLVNWHQRIYHITLNDRATQIAAFAFDASVWELWPYLTIGASIHIPNEEVRRSPSKLLEWLARKAITVCFLPTPLAETVLKEEFPASLTLRFLLTGGDKLHRVYRKALPFKLVNHYGPTEDTVVTTGVTVILEKTTEPPIGHPIDNTQVYILDTHLKQVPINIPGELYIGGVGLARGYLNRPELTAEKFIPNPFSPHPNARLYKTGDLVRYLPDGNLEYLARIDHQVKIRGFRIELGEIEAVLNQDSTVREAIAMVREDKAGHKRLVAYIVSKFVPDRLPIQSVCLMEIANKPQFTVKTEDISASGVGLVDVPSFCQTGQTLRFCLQLSDISEELWLEGKIAWCKGQRAGIQFIFTSTKERAQLHKIVEKIFQTQGFMKVTQRTSFSHLRAVLQEKLPDYMIPTSFVFLSSLPLTPNGKIDRKALPAPDRVCIEEGFEAPRTQTEKILADIWASVLNVKRVSIHDNFFELGGDSIISLQVISRAQPAGLKLTPKQVFQHQTIAELALVAGTTSTLQVEQKLVTGTVPLTPIQHWFFEQNLPKEHHFNQSILLEVSPLLTQTHLERILSQLLWHHDALRLRFSFQHEQEISANCSLLTATDDTSVEKGTGGVLNLKDLSKYPIDEQLMAIEEIATELQGSLNLSQGPLLYVVLFHLGNERSNRLLFIIHHLAIDGVSWRILLKDFVTAYQQLMRGDEAIMLPPKTTSFKQWAECLTEYAQSEVVSAELNYWWSQFRSRVVSLPLDYLASPATNTVSSTAQVSVSLSVAETRALLQEVPSIYHTQINDILLTALVQSFAEWTNEQVLIVDLEEHGRKEALFENIDLSRTVGWFTSLFPALLDLRAVPNYPGEHIKSVKEQLRQISKQGIHYGLLRYLNPETTRYLQKLPEAEVSFHYLEQFDPVFSEAPLLGVAQEFKGSDRSLLGQRRYLLEINAIIHEDKLKLSWTYSENFHQQSTIERLAQDFIKALQILIVHCQSPEAGGYTPSDFPLTNLKQVTLDRLLAKRQIDDLYPLSPTQQGMLFHSFYTPESGVYFEQLHLTLEGALNIFAFKQAWQQVINRYTILRTAIVWKGLEQPLQMVYSQVKLPWLQQDWRDFSIAEQQERLTDFLFQDRKQGFDLTQVPLMRCAVIQIADNTHKFIWSHHHLLLDGWSIPLLFKEALALYEAFCQEQLLRLEPARPYQEYIAWLQQQDISKTEAFWKDRLKGFTAPTPFQVDNLSNKTPSLLEETSGEYTLELSKTTTEALQSFAQQHYLTLNTLIQGAWALLLSRYSGEKNVVFGVTVSGRPISLANVESMVGLFINTLPVRVQVSEETLLLPWLQQLQNQQVELEQYIYTPLFDIQEWSEIPRGTPLFESIVVFENFPIDNSLKEYTGSIKMTDIQTIGITNYPLTIIAIPTSKLLLKITYNSNRFLADTITRMMGHFKTLLESMLAGKTQKICELSILTQAEQQQLLDWNNTQTDYPKGICIHQLFEKQVERAPDAVAIVFGAQQLSYQELNCRANQLAHYLISLGVKSEVLVGICIQRSLEMVIGLLGILKAGGAYVPLDPAYPKERLAFILEDAQVPILLTQESLIPSLPQQQAKLLCLDKQWQMISSNYSTENLWTWTHSDNLAYVIYTSGSTGKPKGVAIEHHSAVVLLTWAKEVFTSESLSGVLASTSICFDLSVFELFVPLSWGGQVMLVENALHLPTLAAHPSEVTLVNTVPSAISELVKINGIPASVRVVNLAGEPLQNALVQKIYQQETIQQVFNLYGPSEDTTYSTFTVIPKGCQDSPSIGYPIANTQVYVLNTYLQAMPIGVYGELYIGGDGLARGYFNRPALTAEKFIPNPFSHDSKARLYKTGDLVRYKPDGQLDFLGRIDHQVKMRGFRIELGEIEAVLHQHPSVQEAVVIIREDNPGDKRLVAYIITKTQSFSTTQLRHFLKDKLPEYMIPSAFVLLETLPLTPNGKIDRKALPQPEGVRADLETSYVAPQSEMENQIAMILQKVLQVEKVGLDDNFFDLGGNSLLLLQVQSQLGEILNQEVPVVALFQYPTVKTLVHHLEHSPDKPIPEKVGYERAQKQKETRQRRKRHRRKMEK